MFTADMFAPIIAEVKDTLLIIVPAALGLFAVTFAARKGFSLLKSFLNKA